MSTRVGIEIGSGSVRIAAVADAKGRPRLVRYAEAALPYGAVVDGVIADRAAVRSAIGICLAKGGFKASRTSGVLRARVCVAGLRAIIREMDMPPVPDSELDGAVKLQASELLPFPMEKTLLSARALGPSAHASAGDGAAARNRVLVAAAHRDLVEPVVDVVTSSGVVVERVELSAMALLRALADSKSDAGPEAIVSVGAELTTVVVHERGEPLFVRTIAGGGNSITRAIASALDLPMADAESVKRRLGASASIASRVPPEAVAAARDGSAGLLAEIRSSLEYFASLEGRGDLSLVVLTGGGAQLSGFMERLQHQVRSTVVAGSWTDLADPGGVDVDQLRLGPSGAVVIGLALDEPAGRKVLDLVPPEALAYQRQRRAERIVAAAAVVVFAGLAAGGALRFLQVHNAEANVTSLEGTISVLQKEIPRYDQVAREDAAISSDESLGKPLVSHEVNWPAVFANLAYYTPSQVAASGFSGTVVVPPAATTGATTGGSTSTSTAAAAAAEQAAAAALPPRSATIGNLSLSFTAPGYPSFQQWFDAMLRSKKFEIEQFSGVTSGSASTSGRSRGASQISFSAQLGITGVIHTNRLGEFEVKQR
jgi:type IV pilus assembly protein PilM